MEELKLSHFIINYTQFLTMLMMNNTHGPISLSCDCNFWVSANITAFLLMSLILQASIAWIHKLTRYLSHVKWHCFDGLKTDSMSLPMELIAELVCSGSIIDIWLIHYPCIGKRLACCFRIVLWSNLLFSSLLFSFVDCAL